MEAQVFCDRLFQAFGHNEYKKAGATLEFRVKSKEKQILQICFGENVY